ncbi:bifunctional riboflavin kinase/FAD synthetase [Arachnia propionica]|uniref:bifunctional riboflavin kinase/FAD synthetase n=1 Tax=Arachnia propionica TaxID=1750 RepID=UPI0021AB7BD6|nr:bifunctional riboflavin kinase/FAD synthetase [Arachnia propionica]MDO5084077.1 bifunctional riboflavin kinase/FAD synthetase [Arachnia propionica]
MNRGNRIVAIGNFDGVHRGHQSVLQAERGDDELVVITFWPHPLTVLRPEAAPKLVTGLEQRIDLLKAAGAREVRVVRFDEKVAAMSPEEFVERFVVPLEPRVVVVGENFRFGHRAAGDVAALRELAAGRFEVRALELAALHEQTTCSSLIRSALDSGDVELVAEHLGRWFRFSGVVVVGDQRGRELGFPTANLIVPDEMVVPADGVYAGWLTPRGGERLPAAISVGSNPTFEGVDRRVETHVLDRVDLELYGVHIDVDFVARLRGQVRFDGVEQLIDQMQLDVAECRRLLGLSEAGPVSS